ncbi:MULTISPECIES: hypothetical protein [unclassified Streptomyces]|uniref:hypothetical protein n=1 Tax=unclassified Streptomyces TaxID=2593676 RepID=UPI0022B6C445|nr:MULTISPECIES: hypothetical protein [unclassified Streptomyces]MCZ7416025.1 hypothetical protein [Streptomyces sp. WMMC897]MCZ7434168.1 hypothetical protein [Streptomyces sp. WMMC1477]
MTTTPRPDSETAARRAKVQEALTAQYALADALRRAGIQLPAMEIRTPWADEAEGGARYALIHLGVCSAPVAHLLAETIARGAER